MLAFFPKRAFSTGLHEAQGVHRNGMAPPTHMRRVLVPGLRLRVRGGGGVVRATAGLHQLPQLLARGETLEEIRPCLHD